MNPTHKLRFNAQAAPPVEHDKRLVRRYLLQSLLRMATWQIGGIIILVSPLLLLTGHAHDLLNPDAWDRKDIFSVIFYPFVVPVILTAAMVRAQLLAMREAGLALTEERMSSRPSRALTSVFDPLTTFDLCAETLSGLAVGEALGYGGPAVFRHYAFQGRILLGSWRPLWLGRSIEVSIASGTGQTVEIRV